MIKDTLSDFCQQLIDHCNSIQSSPLSAPSDDHRGFMIATFAARQLDQLHGIGYLIQGESHAQAGILARSMLEGFALLYWANAKAERALRWRAHCLVHDLQLLRQKQKDGEHIEPGHESELIERLRSDAQVFLKPKKRKQVTEQVLGNPSSYQSTWHVDDNGTHLTISSIIEGLEGGDGQDLRALYRSFSKYVHWGIEGFAAYLSRTPSGYSMDIQSEPRDALGAMAMGFQSCIQTFLLLAVHFKLSGDLESLSALKDEYVKAMNSLRLAD